MRFVFLGFAAIFVFCSAAAFFLVTGSPWTWTAENFSSFGTLMGGIAGPLALVFAAEQFSASKNAENEARKAERAAQSLRDIQLAIDRASDKLDALLGKADIIISAEREEPISLPISYFLGITQNRLESNPIPNFVAMKEFAADQRSGSVPASHVALLERCATISLQLNRLRHLCAVHDYKTETNIKCFTYGEEYYQIIQSLDSRGYPVEKWPLNLDEIRKVCSGPAPY